MVYSQFNMNKKEPTIWSVLFVVRIMGLDRLLRILIACRPLALPTVPACAALPKKQCPTLFFYLRQTLSGSSPDINNKKIRRTNR